MNSFHIYEAGAFFGYIMHGARIYIAYDMQGVCLSV